MAQVLAQNRVSLAVPLLPESVLKGGVTVKQGTAGAIGHSTVSKSRAWIRTRIERLPPEVESSCQSIPYRRTPPSLRTE